MSALYTNFFSRFGMRRQLHSDQGKHFESKLFAELCTITGVNKTRTTPFHPRSDGQTERMNRTILQMLRTSVTDNSADWPSKIPIVLAAYRMTVHKTTGITPNFAMLGREVLMPATLIAKPPDEPSKISVPFVTQFQDNLRQAHDQVRAATQQTAKTQKTYFDKQVRGPSFHCGQLVWLYWPRPLQRSRFKKLLPVWHGPWRIIEFKTSIVVVIRHEVTHKRQTVHVDRRTACYSNPDNLAPPAAVHSAPEPSLPPVVMETEPIEHQQSTSVTTDASVS